MVTQASPQDKSVRRWNFKPAGENAVIAGLGIAGGAAAIGSLYVAFGPALTAAGLGYGLVRYVNNLLIRDTERSEQIRGTLLPPISGYQAKKDEIARLSRIYGLKTPPVLCQDVAAIFHDNAIGAHHFKTARIITSEATLAKYSPAQWRFFLAHELAHIKNGDSQSTPKTINFFFALNPFLKFRKLFTVKTMMFGIGAYVAAGAFLGIPALTLAAGIATAFTAGAFGMVVPSLLFRAASRMAERRADRNAIYITRDFEAAASGLRAVAKASLHPQPYLYDLISTHPTYTRRVKSLWQSWKTASAYPDPGLLSAPAQNLSQNVPPFPPSGP